MFESKLIIAYWGVKGRGEVLKLLAEYMGLPYETKIYSDPNEWFQKDKPALKTNFPNLPYIQDGDQVMTESEACIMYLVRKSMRLDLMGSNAEEVVHITQLKGVLNDLVDSFMKVVANKEGDLAKGIQDTCVPKLTLLSKHLGNNDWLIGKLTLVDFFLAQITEILSLNGDWIEKLPNLSAHLNRFQELPAIKAYNASDRCLKMPYLPPTKVNPNFKNI